MRNGPSTRSLLAVPDQQVGHIFGGSTSRISTRLDGTSDGKKTFRIADHLGSNRVYMEENLTIKTADYEPFGKAIAGAGTDMRQSFIDKEKDFENGLGDFGVRKYEEETGRFLSVDPLWEKYRATTAYGYANNNPLTTKDETGAFWFTIHGEITKTALAGLLSRMDIAVVVGANQGKDMPDLLGGRYVSAQHFDNSDFKEGWRYVNGALGGNDLARLGGSLHALQDFYSHSNYVELARDYYGGDNKVPTFDVAQKDPGFLALWSDKGVSGQFGRPGNPTHDDLSKDKPGRPGYEQARRLATLHSRAFVKEWMDRRPKERFGASGSWTGNRSGQTGKW